MRAIRRVRVSPVRHIRNRHRQLERALRARARSTTKVLLDSRLRWSPTGRLRPLRQYSALLDLSFALVSRPMRARLRRFTASITSTTQGRAAQRRRSCGISTPLYSRDQREAGELLLGSEWPAPPRAQRSSPRTAGSRAHHPDKVFGETAEFRTKPQRVHRDHARVRDPAHALRGVNFGTACHGKCKSEACPLRLRPRRDVYNARPEFGSLLFVRSRFASISSVRP